MFKTDSCPKKVFILDAEVDGLYGDIFSIGALVADRETFKIEDSFNVTSRPAMQAVKEPFVLENVIPPILKDSTMQVIEGGSDILLEQFWAFYLKHKKDCLIIADFGTPVEAKVFYECIKARPERTFEGPYPLHELATILLVNNMDPDITRSTFFEDPSLIHSPYWDAMGTLNILKKIYPSGM